MVTRNVGGGEGAVVEAVDGLPVKRESGSLKRRDGRAWLDAVRQMNVEELEKWLSPEEAGGKAWEVCDRLCEEEPAATRGKEGRQTRRGQHEGTDEGLLLKDQGQGVHNHVVTRIFHRDLLRHHK